LAVSSFLRASCHPIISCFCWQSPTTSLPHARIMSSFQPSNAAAPSRLVARRNSSGFEVMIPEGWKSCRMAIAPRPPVLCPSRDLLRVFSCQDFDIIGRSKKSLWPNSDDFLSWQLQPKKPPSKTPQSRRENWTPQRRMS